MTPESATRRAACFRNDDGELRRMSQWFREFATNSGVPQDRAVDFELCLNELVTNVIHHAYGDDRTHEIRILLGHQDGELSATVEDDGRPFDPGQAEPREPGETLETARVGGWGIPIVRAFADEILYERSDGRNRVTIVSRL